eukprot:5456714-Pyramimonas_sp.AAC.1
MTSRILFVEKGRAQGKGLALWPPEGPHYMTLFMTLCSEEVGGKTRVPLQVHGQFLDKINAATVLRKV